MGDIIDAIAEFRVACERAGFKPPSVILLDDVEEGRKLMCELMATNAQRFVTLAPGEFGKPIEHPDGSVWMEIEIVGMKVRWPARQFALPGGGYVWQ